MDLRKLSMNNKAVSPVIGVILMVAITVILAAAIGSAVFGQGTAESAPQANLDIKVVNGCIDHGEDGLDPAIVRFEHLGGDPINFKSTTTKILVTVDDTTISVQGSAINALGVLSAGEVSKNLRLVEFDGGAIHIPAGSIVNINVVDIKTRQLIFEGDVKF